MQLKVISSSSAGNAYILENEKEALIIECGVQFSRIKEALSFNLAKVKACLVTHEHQDHCKATKDVLQAGIRVIASKGTMENLGLAGAHRFTSIQTGEKVTVGGFDIRAFDIKHDCSEPLGFLIRHDECGTVLFLTDTYYCEYTFPGLNNVIVEANYCQSILDARVAAGASPEMLRNRVITSHMSLETCKEFLLANDLSKVHNIVLIHLSDGNSDARRFKKEIGEITGATVWTADKGLTISLNKTPF